MWFFMCPMESDLNGRVASNAAPFIPFSTFSVFVSIYDSVSVSVSVALSPLYNSLTLTLLLTFPSSLSNVSISLSLYSLSIALSGHLDLCLEFDCCPVSKSFAASSRSSAFSSPLSRRM